MAKANRKRRWQTTDYGGTDASTPTKSETKNANENKPRRPRRKATHTRLESKQGEASKQHSQTGVQQLNIFRQASELNHRSCVTVSCCYQIASNWEQIVFHVLKFFRLIFFRTVWIAQIVKKIFLFSYSPPFELILEFLESVLWTQKPKWIPCTLVTSLLCQYQCQMNHIRIIFIRPESSDFDDTAFESSGQEIIRR